MGYYETWQVFEVKNRGCENLISKGVGGCVLAIKYDCIPMMDFQFTTRHCDGSAFFSILCQNNFGLWNCVK